MRQCDIIRHLFSDLKESTSQLVLGDYHNLFEKELQEHYPFSPDIENWLIELYKSEKYESLENEDRSLLFEKAHPFLFLRDLATINNWRQGFVGDKRRDQISGLFFSMTPEVALEASLALCQPKFVGESVSPWFDASQVMKNLEFQPGDSLDVDAWRGCAYFYLYMHFTNSEQPPQQDEIYVMMDPFRTALDHGRWKGNKALRAECQKTLRALEPEKFQTMIDRIF